MGALLHIEATKETVVVTIREQWVIEEKMFRELDVTFRKLLEEKHYKTFLIDLSAVETMQSVAIGTLIMATAKAKERGCRFVVCGIRPRMKQVFSVLKCNVLWEVYEDCAQARTALGLEP